jgi:phosphocarrier protein HPr
MSASDAAPGRNVLEPLSRQIAIVNELGLHARSAAKIAEIAQKAAAPVWIDRDGETVDARSIIDMLTLACARDSIIAVRVEDEADLPVLEEIVALVADGFGE